MNFLKSKISFLNNFLYGVLLVLIIIFDFVVIQKVKSYYYEPYFNKIDNNYYCLSDHSVNRTILKGWVKKENKYYYFDDVSGIMCRNEIKKN